MAAAVGVSLRRGFPATSLGRVSLQVSPGALVRLGIVPVTEAAWVERPRRSRESPGSRPQSGTPHLCPVRSILSDGHPVPRRSRRVAAGRRLEKIKGKTEVREDKRIAQGRMLEPRIKSIYLDSTCPV